MLLGKPLMDHHGAYAPRDDERGILLVPPQLYRYFATHSHLPRHCERSVAIQYTRPRHCEPLGMAIQSTPDTVIARPLGRGNPVYPDHVIASRRRGNPV